ncbi:MAG: Rpn family recombination-promoting nuclease/putative transposase [bacterium]
MNEALNHPHDKFIKEVLSNRENAQDFFLNYLPESIQAIIDLESLEICKDSFIISHTTCTIFPPILMIRFRVWLSCGFRFCCSSIFFILTCPDT